MMPCPIRQSGEFLLGSRDGMEHWRAAAAGVVGEINAKLTSVQKYKVRAGYENGWWEAFAPENNKLVLC